MTIVYTTGVFDLFHYGHLQILKNARTLGDKLIVGIQDDQSVQSQKGQLPVFSTQERVEIIRELKCVDAVIVYRDLDQRPILEQIKPAIMVQGSDWLGSSDRSQIVEYLSRHHIRLIRLPYTQGISTSRIKKQGTKLKTNE